MLRITVSPVTQWVNEYIDASRSVAHYNVDLLRGYKARRISSTRKREDRNQLLLFWFCLVFGFSLFLKVYVYVLLPVSISQSASRIRRAWSFVRVWFYCCGTVSVTMCFSGSSAYLADMLFIVDAIVYHALHWTNAMFKPYSHRNLRNCLWSLVIAGWQQNSISMSLNITGPDTTKIGSFTTIVDRNEEQKPEAEREHLKDSMKITINHKSVKWLFFHMPHEQKQP